MDNDFPRVHALNPCLHCAVGELVAFRARKYVDEDAFAVAKGLVEALADMCSSWQGADRAELVTRTRWLFEQMLGDVERNQWKTDNARPNQTDNKRH